MDLIHRRKKYTVFKMVDGKIVKIGVSRSKKAILSAYPQAYKLYAGKGRGGKRMGWFGHSPEHRDAYYKGRRTITPQQHAELIRIMTRVRKAKTRQEKDKLLKFFDRIYKKRRGNIPTRLPTLHT